jgi:pimeloyl-ACP methyl ester carboxylesterase
MGGWIALELARRGRARTVVAISPAELTHAVRAFARAPGFPDALVWLTSNGAAGVGEIACPVSVLWGSRDFVLPVRQAARFGARIRQAEVHVLQGLGHAPMSDDPRLIADAILAVTDRPAAQAGGGPE